MVFFVPYFSGMHVVSFPEFMLVMPLRLSMVTFKLTAVSGALALLIGVLASIVASTFLPLLPIEKS